MIISNTASFLATLSSFIILVSPSSDINEVSISQCCSVGYQLIKNGLNKYDCVDNTNGNWTATIYSPTEKRFLPPGSEPSNWKFTYNRRPICDQFENLHFATLKEATYAIFENGSMWISDKFIHPMYYCISPRTALFCTPLNNIHIKKCCGEGSYYSETKHSCVFNNTVTFDNNFYYQNWTLISGFPECSEDEILAITGKINQTYYLNANGTINYVDNKRETIPPIFEYCAEKILEYPSEEASVFTCTKYNKNHEKVAGDDFRFTLYPLGLFLSVFFLAITLIASCLLPGTYHALHWKCQTHHVACLLFGDLLLAITQVSGQYIQGTACVLIATAMHFLFLSAFFWLNTMCFNIWWTFRDLRPTNLDKTQESCRLKLYQIYAWGGPLIIVLMGTLMDQVLYYKYPTALRPKFGVQRCWFYGDAELFVYFFGPVGLLLLINLVLFAATTRELTCGLWKREVVKSNTERATLGHVCLKLVIVMGITWIVDVLSWAIGGPAYVWYLTDIVNSLQGVLIFIVVGCQPQVWAQMKRLWCFSAFRGGANDQVDNVTIPSTTANDNSNVNAKTGETFC